MENEKNKKLKTKKQSVKEAIKQIMPKPSSEGTVDKLELLITIVDRRKGEFFADLIQSFDVNMQLVTLGRGTAGAEIIRYLGLADSQKTVIFSVIKHENVEAALSAISDKFNSIKNGKGIAFTVPMSSIIGVTIYGFLSNNRDMIKEEQQ